ncbi:MAG TPA: flavodoxin domain-containing protein, partial [Hyphomicrobiales bacterium]|nr:flavodoxin domain-containing protein [Hyphomicrobiales bacterium]
AEPLTVLYATESGNSERLAADVAKAARRQGFKPNVLDMADVEDLAVLGKAKRLVVIAATWGEGDPPGRAAHVYADLMGDKAPRLDGVEFGVLALGDSAYVDFCGVGKKLDERLEALGGKRAVDRVDCDLDFAAPAADWIAGALKTLAPPQAAAPSGSVIAVDFGQRSALAAETGPVEAEIAELVMLSSSRSEKETFHLALGFNGAMPAYEPGDALDLYPENAPAEVDAVLAATGLAGNDALRADLIRARDITTLSPKAIDNFIAATGHAGAKELRDSANLREWIDGRQLIDLFEAFPATLAPEQLTGMLRPLAPRAYSIASSRKETDDEAHLLVTKVAYESHGRARAGVASGFVAGRVKKGATLKVKLRPNKHFRLPGPDDDLVMIGPGTGVAPFRAFVQERRATGAKGRNWLFFGDQRYLHDFLYQLEWQDALKDGSLARLDLAFSRDTPEKVYVQHRMWEARKELVDWLDGGARLYVCGDATRMAKDVRAMLVRIHGEVKGLAPDAAEAAVRALESGRRYLQDVY